MRSTRSLPSRVLRFTADAVEGTMAALIIGFTVLSIAAIVALLIYGAVVR